ncbi:MAG: hypothetical protein PVH91_06570 [Pseudomonadales bacterium]|jgi:hypothetical protein
MRTPRPSLKSLLLLAIAAVPVADPLLCPVYAGPGYPQPMEHFIAAFPAATTKDVVWTPRWFRGRRSRSEYRRIRRAIAGGSYRTQAWAQTRQGINS